ncbi:MAG: hypothetical protein ABIQ88_20755 [Chitinophagaceae bacterium]
MKKLLIVGFVLIMLAACNKDKYQTKPQISIKSTSTSVVGVNGGITITLSFTDKEGDISDTLYLKKIRLNKTVVPTIRDSIKYKIPDFPDYSKGEIGVALDYQTVLSAISPPPIPGSVPSQPQPDTLLIKFWIRDKGGNVSDTVTTDKIVVLR